MTNNLMAQRLDNLPLSKWHFGLMILCSLSIFFDAFDSTIISVAMPKLMAEWGITKVQAGFLTSASFAGMLAGALFFGYLADNIGRKRVFAVTLLIYSFFTFLCCFAKNYQALFGFRLIVGIGLGGLVPVVSTYLTEYIPPQNRGKFMSWLNGFFQLGQVFAYLVGLMIVVPFGWVWAFAIGGLPAIIVFFVQRHLPESVRYLLQKGYRERALTIVEQIETKILKRVTVNSKEALTNESVNNAKATMKVPVSELFKRQNLKSTVMISVLWFCLSFSAYAVVMWMPVLLTKELGYSLASGFAFLAVAALIGCLGQISAGFVSEKIGRKFTISYSLLGFGVSAYLLFWTGGALGNFFLILMWIFLGSCWGSLYAYTPENFPTAIRGAGSGFASSCGRLGGIFGPALVGFIYAAAGVTAVLHINFVLLLLGTTLVIVLGRETKNKSLEQIEAA